MRVAEYALFAFGSLFVIVDPVAAVPAFVVMTARESVRERLRTARVACVVAVSLLAGFAFLGQPLFRLLGITMPAFQVAAGLVLLLVAFDMLRAQRSPVQETAEETAAAVIKEDVAVTPLAMPMLAGPGALSTVVLLNAQAQSWIEQVVLLLCLGGVGLTSYLTLALAGRGADWLGPIAGRIIERLMGLLLSMIAIRFRLDALRGQRGLLMQ